jgi:hypothetical protein
MKDDFYSFDEDNYRYVGKRTGNTYRLGDKVMIEVKDADMLKKQLTFVIVDTAEKNPGQRQEERDSKHSKGSHKSSHRGSNKGSHKGKKRRR